MQTRSSRISFSAMDKEKTIKMLSALANGIDPVSGEVFPADSPYNHVEISRALFNAVDLIKNTKLSPDKSAPANSHQPWSDSLDNELTDKFLQGLSIEELAVFFQRTKGGIRARLEKLRLIDRYGKRIAFPAKS